MKHIKLAVVTAATCGLLSTGTPVFGADMPDAWITTKAKFALLTADDVSGTAVNVDTINGRVTLHGTVASDAEKAKAEQVVKQIDGVTGVQNLLAVVPKSKQDAAALADDKIEENVEAALERDTRLDDSSITVASVNGGTVVLTGTADSMSNKLRAVEVARAVPGVRKVSSQVTGPDEMRDAEIWRDESRDERPAAGDSPRRDADADADDGGGLGMADAWITSAAKVRLIGNEATPALDINVDTRDGVVTLFGIVPSDEAKRAAEAEVKKVSGVKQVKNELRVVAEAKQEQAEMKDEQIKDTLAKRLDEAPFADDDISIEVKGGAVRLTGTVDSQAERLRALTVARAASGVRSVVDDLRIEQKS